MNSVPPRTLSPWQVIARCSQIGFVIAIPLIILLLSGAKLDKHFGTSPIFLFIGLGLSGITTPYGVYRIVKDLL